MSNPILTGQQLLTAMVNAANPTHKQWTAAELVFGSPQVNADATHNTVVPVSAVDMATYTGSRELFYNRVSLAEIPRGETAAFELDQETTTTAVAALLRTKYKVNLDPDDVIAEPLTPDDSGEYAQIIRAAPNSLKWNGQITVNLTPRLIPLDEALPNNRLDGLTLDMLGIPEE